MEVEFTSNFLKKSKSLPLNEKKKLSDKVEIFRKNPEDYRLKTHALLGHLKGMFAFSLSYSKRVIFIYIDKNTALFLDVGSHGEVYK